MDIFVHMGSFSVCPLLELMEELETDTLEQTSDSCPELTTTGHSVLPIPSITTESCTRVNVLNLVYLMLIISLQQTSRENQQRFHQDHFDVIYAGRLPATRFHVLLLHSQQIQSC